MIEATGIESTAVESGTAEADALAGAFKALGDPTRLRILAVLAGGSRCVCEIQAAIDIPGNLLSHHLKVLREAGLIDGERRGRWIDYTRQDGLLKRLAGALPPDPARLGVDVGLCDDACAREDAEA